MVRQLFQTSLRKICLSLFLALLIPCLALCFLLALAACTFGSVYVRMDRLRGLDRKKYANAFLGCLPVLVILQFSGF